MMMTQGRSGGQPYASSVLLRQTNQVKTVPTNAQVIDPDIQVLLVAQAQHLSDDTLYRDRPVRHARRPAAMVMVDPWSEAMAATPMRIPICRNCSMPGASNLIRPRWWAT